ncbi:MAG: hypothetical protein J5969_06765 [Lachnospiraceae bacterium]|nr:hypothetical protein [Lachnospiraceae bacterium]
MALRVQIRILSAFRAADGNVPFVFRNADLRFAASAGKNDIVRRSIPVSIAVLCISRAVIVFAEILKPAGMKTAFMKAACPAAVHPVCLIFENIEKSFDPEPGIQFTGRCLGYAGRVKISLVLLIKQKTSEPDQSERQSHNKTQEPHSSVDPVGITIKQCLFIKHDPRCSRNQQKHESYDRDQYIGDHV